jgi:hypothetical protein
MHAARAKSEESASRSLDWRVRERGELRPGSPLIRVGRALGRVDDPQAGRVSEGRARVTLSPGARTRIRGDHRGAQRETERPWLIHALQGSRGPRPAAIPAIPGGCRGGGSARGRAGSRTRAPINSLPDGAGRSVDAGTQSPDPGLGRGWEGQHPESRPAPRGGARAQPCEAQQTTSGSRQSAIHGLVHARVQVCEPA